MEFTPEVAKYLKSHIIPEKRRRNAFSGQLPDEEAYLFILRHWIIDLILFVRMIFWLAVPAGIYYLLVHFLPDFMEGPWGDVSLVVMTIWMLYVALIYYIHWLDMALDVIVVTDRRILDIDQHRLFNRLVTEASLSQIQDVTANIRGIVGTLLRFGDITIQTAGESVQIEHKTILHPNAIASQIMKVRDEYLTRMGKQGAQQQEMVL